MRLSIGSSPREGIPEAGVGEKAARAHIARVGAVVHCVAIRVDFMKHAGEERAAVKARVECAQTVGVVRFDLDTAQHLVPALAPLLDEGIEVLAVELLEVDFGLFGADE